MITIIIIIMAIIKKERKEEVWGVTLRNSDKLCGNLRILHYVIPSTCYGTRSS